MNPEERIRALMDEIARLRAENAALRGNVAPDPQAPVFQNMPYSEGMYPQGPVLDKRLATPQPGPASQYMRPMPYKAPAKKRSPFE